MRQASARPHRRGAPSPPNSRAGPDPAQDRAVLEAVKTKPPHGGGLRPVLTASARDARVPQAGTEKPPSAEQRNFTCLTASPSYKSLSALQGEREGTRRLSDGEGAVGLR